ncbi:MAG: S1 RNA-binding domain-containing protein [Cyanobacteriota bacterium]
MLSWFYLEAIALCDFGSMRVTLTQSSPRGILRGSILVQIQTNDVCTQFWTSTTFDPYNELYIWLGQIRDSQLPAKMIVDEEGRGVELIAELLRSDLVQFRIEPWFCSNDTATRLDIMIERLELLKAFHDGIIKFIQDEYNPSQWSLIDTLNNTNWGALLNPPNITRQHWQKRLAMYGGGHGRVPETGRETVWKQLTPEQRLLVTLHDVLDRATLLAANAQTTEAYALVSLYQTLPIDIALGELDPKWYEARREELDRKFDGFKLLRHRRKPQHRPLAARTRLATLKLGQLVDGRVYGIKPYGVFVDIGGYKALLHISAISQLPVEHPEQIFQVDDWVRAIVVWLDVERGAVSLSTGDLEPESGDMLKDPLIVYANAEEMAARYCQHVLSKLEGK